MQGAPIRLVLSLPPSAIRPLVKHLALRPGRRIPVTLIWHDTPDGSLATTGRTLTECHDGRRIAWRAADLCAEPMHPAGNDGPVRATSPTRDALMVDLPAPCAPLARFVGHRRTARLGACTLSFLDGTLHAGRRRMPHARLILDGPAAALAAIDLPGTALPDEPLAATALSLALRLPPPPSPLLPDITFGLTVDDTIARLLAHFGARIHRLAPHAAAGPEGVHQMRVTIRRARSALRLFRRIAPTPPSALAALSADLKSLAAILGPARDWDVFIDGTARAVAAAAPDNPAAASRLIRAARHERATAGRSMREHLASPAFHALMRRIALAALARPWHHGADPERLHIPIAAFASHTLQRQFKRLIAPGDSLDTLPEPRLHGIRIEAKRMRYTAELFAPLFDPKRPPRFIARLADLQECLGHLNDAAVAATLLDRLGPAGRSFGGGVARGLLAARGDLHRPAIARAWRRFRTTKRFWT